MPTALGYDRVEIRSGIVHLGLGAFARAHLAVYVDDLLAAGHDDSGIIGVSLHHDDTQAALEPQDGPYTLGVVDGTTTTHRVIGSIRHRPPRPVAAGRAAHGARASDTTLVTVTVTEKGYCSNPSTRSLDHHPARRRPRHRPPRPAPQLPRPSRARCSRTTRQRRAPVTSPCSASTTSRPTERRCAASVTQLAAIVDPTLARWINEHVGFPFSMVDRIVPATDDELPCGRRLRASGWTTPGRSAPSRYSQWVVERRWAAPMPPLADVGCASRRRRRAVGDAEARGPQRAAHRGRALRPAPRPRHRRSRRGRSARVGTSSTASRPRSPTWSSVPPGADVDDYIATTHRAIRQHRPRSSLCDRSPPIPATSCPHGSSAPSVAGSPTGCRSTPSPR